MLMPLVFMNSGTGIIGAGLTPLFSATIEDRGMVTTPIPVTVLTFKNDLRLMDMLRFLIDT